MEKTCLLGLSKNRLTDEVTRLGLPRFTATQILDWLYKKRVEDISQMTNLSLKSRELLSEHFQVGREAPYQEVRSVDGTAKYLFRTLSGGLVETVFIPDEDRGTVCVSCQEGCKMNCLFCMTGKQGFKGNLTARDIVNQVLSLPETDRLTNLVFMGMGEPLDNLDAIFETIEVLTATWGLAWSPKRITISTCGLEKGIDRVLQGTQVHLAVSLHAAVAETRRHLMPAERAFPIEKVVERCLQADFSHQRRLSFEYIVFEGINDSEASLKALLKLLRPLDCRVNLIRFHKIPGVDLEGVSPERMVEIRDYLTSHGLFTTIRASRGEDIWAACGMLSTKGKKA